MPIRPQLYRVIANHKNEGRRITIFMLAEKAGVSYKTLWRWATGRTQSVNYQVLDTLCRELDCDPGDLLAYIPDSSISGNGQDG